MTGDPYTPDFLRTEKGRSSPPGNRLLVLIGSGLVVISLAAFVGGLLLPGLTAPEIPAGSVEAGSAPPSGEAAPSVGEGRRNVREDRRAADDLRLTVPKMARVDDVPVRSAAPEDTDVLDAGPMRLRGTGLPWREGTNTYIAGHRIGYAGTKSFLLFYDLNRLQEGDAVVLESGARRYVYRVTGKLVVGPEEGEVTEPVPGKSLVSLQTCTLPDYRKRLVVRAELDKVRPVAPESRA
jgi:sortase A